MEWDEIYNINNDGKEFLDLRFADDIVLFSDSYWQLQEIIGHL